jgi:hypothetical protein
LIGGSMSYKWQHKQNSLLLRKQKRGEI